MQNVPTLEHQPHPANLRRFEIDGLRAVAVLSVLAFHAGAPGFSGGFVGVDVFFVISGYLICSILLREISRGSFSIVRFYERRCKRILPALIVVLLACMAAALVLLSPEEAARMGSGVVATALSVSNVQFYLKGSYFDHGGILNPLLMTWSLAVEEQFYLVFPLLMLFLFRRMRGRIALTLWLLCAASLALSVYSEFRHPEFGFYLPFTRAWELGAGTLLAVLQIEQKRGLALPAWARHCLSVAGLGLILACVFRYSPGTRFPGYEAVAPVLGTVFLLLAQGGIANRLLALQPFPAIGAISYSLYLWHWPLLSFASIISPQPLSDLARWLLMLIAFIAASLSYHYVESPFRTAKYTNSGRTIRAYGMALLLVAIAGASYRRTDGFRNRAPELARMEDSLDMNRATECISTADRGPVLSAHCYPAPSAAPAIALLGDSHAEAIEATLRHQLAASGTELVAITAYSCPPLQGTTRVLDDAPEHSSSCARFNAQALALITARADIKTVVLAGSWAMVPSDHFVPVADETARGESTSNLVAGIRAEIVALEAAGKRVVLLDDWPSLTFVPMQNAKLGYLPARARLAHLLNGLNAMQHDNGRVLRAETVTPAAEAVRKALIGLPDRDPGLRVIDTKQLLCTNASCAYADGPNLLYTDGNHVSHFGAERILGSVSLAP